MDTDKNKINKLLSRRVDENGFFPSRAEIEERLASGQKLKFYYGIDPTGPDIHLGHTVQLWLLKELISLGHDVTLLVGDFTAKIGDPTDKSAARKQLSDEEIDNNKKNYLGQVHKILPEGSFKTDYNSRWLKNMDMAKIIDIASNFTVQQMIIRDMFQERLSKNKPIGIHEFLYPLMQGYDSVAMEIDGEIGGHDQIFNMLVGRDMEKKYLGKDKIVLATKLLVNKDTGKKMSKSEGEIIAVNDEPSEIRRKILAIDDGMVKLFFELCTAEDQEWIDAKTQELEPRELKELLAEKLVEIYHGADKVKEVHAPKEIEEKEIKDNNLAGIIKILGFAGSMSESKNLITAGAVEVNGQIETNWKTELKAGDRIKVGKGKFGVIK